MKFRVIVAILIMGLFLLSGCNKSTKSDVSPIPLTQQTEQAGTSPKEFVNTHKDWVKRLEGLADKTNNAYNELSGKKITNDDFITKIEQIYEDMKKLNFETDVKAEFNLSEKDKQEVNFDGVTRAYTRASKDLNDFLYYAPHLKDDPLKVKYDELMKSKYNSDIVELKKLLKM